MSADRGIRYRRYRTGNLHGNAALPIEHERHGIALDAHGVAYEYHEHGWVERASRQTAELVRLARLAHRYGLVAFRYQGTWRSTRWPWVEYDGVTPEPLSAAQRARIIWRLAP